MLFIVLHTSTATVKYMGEFCPSHLWRLKASRSEGNNSGCHITDCPNLWSCWSPSSKVDLLLICSLGCSFTYFLFLSSCRSNSSSTQWALSSPSGGWWVWKWPLGENGVNGPQNRESCMSAETNTCSLAIWNLCTHPFCFPISFHLGRACNCEGSSEAQPSCGCPDPAAKAGTCTYCMIC